RIFPAGHVGALVAHGVGDFGLLRPFAGAGGDQQDEGEGKAGGDEGLPGHFWVGIEPRAGSKGLSSWAATMDYPIFPPPPTPLAKAAPRPGFIAGLGAVFSGIGFVATTPAVWPLALVPIAVGLGLSAALSVLAIKFIPPLFVAWLGATSGLLAKVLGV